MASSQESGKLEIVDSAVAGLDELDAETPILPVGVYVLRFRRRLELVERHGVRPTMGIGVLYFVSVAMTESLDIPGDLSRDQLFARGVLRLGYR